MRWADGSATTIEMVDPFDLELEVASGSGRSLLRRSGVHRT
jgi:hypothetical protein